LRTASHVLALERPASGSWIGCDAGRCYIFSGSPKVHIIDLSKALTNVETRIRSGTVELTGKDRVSSGMVVANGLAVVVGYQSTVVYTVPLFEKLGAPVGLDAGGAKAALDLTLPLASDGFFVFSLNVRRAVLRAFSLEVRDRVPTMTLHRKMDLRFRGPPPEQSPEIIPKSGLVACFCNGPVFTAVIAVSREIGEARSDARLFHLYRSFSALDGTHIADYMCLAKYPIEGMCYDPWRKTVWEVAAGGLFRTPSYSSQPLWLAGIPTSAVSYGELISSFARAKSPADLVVALANFFRFYGAHLFGASFRAFGRREGTYDNRTAAFFGPTTPGIVRALMGQIRFFIDRFNGAITNNTKPEWWLAGVLIALLELLDYNLSNFGLRVYDGRIASFNDTIEIIELFETILGNQALACLHRLVAFSVVNSFSLLYSQPSKRTSKLFLTIFVRMPPDFLMYMIDVLHLQRLYPYALLSEHCRELFSPILRKSTEGALLPHESELIGTFMRSLMLEARSIYTEFMSDLPPAQKGLCLCFEAFSSMVAECGAGFFDSMRTATGSSKDIWRSRPFGRLFQRWLVLLEPFADFARATKEVTPFVQMVYSRAAESLAEAGASVFALVQSRTNASESFLSPISTVFWELFSLYSNFISGLLEGGVELKQASRFTWLAVSSSDSKISADEIEELFSDLKADAPTRRVDAFRRGFSFTIADHSGPSPEQLESFVRRLTARAESGGVAALMDFLYQKVSNMLNKKLTPENRRTERILLAALSKQLGLSGSLYELAAKVTSGEKNIVVSHLLRQVLEAIYRIRRRLMESRQRTQSRLEQAEQTGLTSPAADIEEDFDRYVDEVFRKCVYLLHIQPSLRFSSSDVQTSFPELLKNVQTFILSPLTIAELLNTLSIARDLRGQVTLGLALMNAILKRPQFPICAFCIATRFAHSSIATDFASA
jgi:hypothetical protein